MPHSAFSDTLGRVKPPDHRCLIVDDSTAFCVAARGVLEAAGMTVVGTASTLATAIESARSSRPDLILVDIDLGGESGFDVVEALHDDDPRFTMILVSTHDEEDFADMVESSSAVGFLPKFELSADRILGIVARERNGA
ncbi:response regulator receiver domain-containing protein [Williamsia limnetica]|uniref:Response regulator receiver domain-containing protein n=1 Tax=Williamsia limnetica TaxID=882452 RepID=A0A318RPP6_WILLI|nr:response regulator [Williamsia limnetica]PYE18610.1 response regulator receiver domain-containing protein [Williamsia limnetica]